MHPEITLPNGRGRIRGTEMKDYKTSETIAYRYAGIPYALPPTGPRRWKKPAPLPSDFKYGEDGTTFQSMPAKCYQPSNYLLAPPPQPAPPQTEDCLYLSIWTPCSNANVNANASIAKGPLPVLIYIHGGWLQVGDALVDDKLDDPSELIGKAATERPFIVVAPAYRLNVFGFLAHEALLKEEDAQTTGNYGFWDQRMALEWVAKNISAFGGDPANMTLWGLSAGAHSVHSQLLHEYQLSQRDASYRPLIRRALFQSNAAVLPAKHNSEVSCQLDQLCELLPSFIPTGVKDDRERIEHLRKVPAQALVDVLPKMPLHTFRATYDSQEGKCFVSKDWIDAMRNGRFATWCRKLGIYFIVGETANEDTLYRLINAPKGENITAELERQLHNYYPLDVAKALIAAYPPTEVGEQACAQRFGEITSDSQVFAAERLFVEYLQAQEGQRPIPVLRYRIDFRAGALDLLGLPEWMGVSHGCDNPLWWYKEKLGGWKGGQLAVLKEWLKPLVSFVNGDDAEHVAREWYAAAQEDAGGRIQRPVRILKDDCSIAVEEDSRWQVKKPIMEVMRQARQQT